MKPGELNAIINNKPITNHDQNISENNLDSTNLGVHVNEEEKANCLDYSGYDENVVIAKTLATKSMTKSMNIPLSNLNSTNKSQKINLGSREQVKKN